jgi:hypothetical protein
MYHHVKKLMYTVRVDEPDPRFVALSKRKAGRRQSSIARCVMTSSEQFLQPITACSTAYLETVWPRQARELWR